MSLYLKGSDDYDGPMMWELITQQVKPSINVGASKLKEDIKSKTLTSFGNDVTKYNTWFKDTIRVDITAEEEVYEENSHMVYKAFKTITNEDSKIQ